MSEYRVNLEMYNGPLDLLLYLIRRDELDIHDIPIARITEQYVQYVDLLKQMNCDLAGEFLVMASTLLEIKTRMLLPSPPPDEQDDEGLGIDPRAELVRQLLEYKSFKDAADDLRQAYDLQSQKFPRRPKIAQDSAVQQDIEDVQVWDLLDAFSNLMKAIGADNQLHQVIYDDTPIELHAADILDRLKRDGSLRFVDIFEGRTLRSEILGLFLALLELIRRKQVQARQQANFSQIHLHLNTQPSDEQADAPAKPLADQDQYISERPAQQDSESSGPPDVIGSS